ncbi:MAG: GNAT family N-acetyltransferase [Lawsonibacter sp.]|jgi:ribosomal-protein-alanine N-acetyltransferase|nr:GNAT family N-acetyltransferase [Lawsonibacter sp.]
MDFILRKWRREDAADVARYADNEKIARNLRDVFPHPYALADAQGFLDICIAGDPEMSLFRAIEVDGRAVGSISLCRGSDVYQKTAELGYWLAEDYWGRGIMTQAVRQLCREGFSCWDIQRIHAEPFAHNAGSRRVLEKAGFSLEGVMRRGVFKRGQVCDFCMYALLREEGK